MFPASRRMLDKLGMHSDKMTAVSHGSAEKLMKHGGKACNKMAMGGVGKMRLGMTKVK